MNFLVKIIEIRQVTHDVKCFRIEKPVDYTFQPGQATDLSINQQGLEEETRPFTFTALARESYLEFTIKRYPEHHGITDRLHQLTVGDELIIRDSWGAIDYKGPGYFIAGGAGITPFIAILRSLYDEGKTAGNKLFFSNKTSADIIYEQELLKIMGEDVVFVLTRDHHEKYIHGHLDEAFIKGNIADFNKHFYVCGPDRMVVEIVDTLRKAGASTEALVFEK
jgi:ferredoxin-NADP reductase